jgi:hypothetical protein
LEACTQGGLALAEFFGGRPEAMQSVEAALANAQSIESPFNAAILAQAIGEISTQQGDFARADAYLSQALEYYRGHAMRPYIARTLQAQAR